MSWSRPALAWPCCPRRSPADWTRPGCAAWSWMSRTCAGGWAGSGARRCWTMLPAPGSSMSAPGRKNAPRRLRSPATSDTAVRGAGRLPASDSHTGIIGASLKPRSGRRPPGPNPAPLQRRNRPAANRLSARPSLRTAARCLLRQAECPYGTDTFKMVSSRQCRAQHPLPCAGKPARSPTDHPQYRLARLTRALPLCHAALAARMSDDGCP
ncbi:hypothetical protein LHGZ1_0727 [Laribacter hongkongensis]|uniref:Uncharacterized protein n=1 Tax=Laribacter hongkongensis TaxID=168471 RepID=A0A248LFI2_9NEIS|nr:hypothetical protein LHGZ1_0727 [Laribacter hongkongensis]